MMSSGLCLLLLGPGYRHLSYRAYHCWGSTCPLQSHQPVLHSLLPAHALHWDLALFLPQGAQWPHLSLNTLAASHLKIPHLLSQRQPFREISMVPLREFLPCCSKLRGSKKPAVELSLEHSGPGLTMTLDKSQNPDEPKCPPFKEEEFPKVPSSAFYPPQ